MGTGEAALITGLNERTMARYVDHQIMPGGRRIDLATRQPVPGSHRWVHAEDVVAMAVGAAGADQVPAQWRHLVPAAVRHPPAAGIPSQTPVET